MKNTLYGVSNSGSLVRIDMLSGGHEALVHKIDGEHKTNYILSGDANGYGLWTGNTQSLGTSQFKWRGNRLTQHLMQHVVGDKYGAPTAAQKTQLNAFATNSKRGVLAGIK